MSWEDEIAFGNNKGENTLDVIPPITYTPLKCKECGHEREDFAGECGNLIVIEQEEEPTRIEYNCQCVID